LKWYNEYIASIENQKQIDIEKKKKYDADLKDIQYKYQSQIDYWEKEKAAKIDLLQRKDYRSITAWKIAIAKVQKWYGFKINPLKEKSRFTQQSYILYHSNMPAHIQAKILKMFREHGTTAFKGSMMSYADKAYNAWLAKSQAESQSSIKTAQSNAVIANTNLEKTISSMAKNKKDSAGLVKPTGFKWNPTTAKGKPQLKINSPVGGGASIPIKTKPSKNALDSMGVKWSNLDKISKPTGMGLGGEYKFKTPVKPSESFDAVIGSIANPITVKIEESKPTKITQKNMPYLYPPKPNQTQQGIKDFFISSESFLKVFDR